MANQQQDETRQRDGASGRRYVAYGLAGIGAAAIAGAAYLVYREKSVEKPDYRLVEKDGDFEVREYPQLLVAETVAGGERDAALKEGFTRLADYIFAKSRPGGKIAMTAPVLSTGSAEGWRTRFVMPSHLGRENLPQPQDEVTLVTLPARKVAVLAFSGIVDDEVIATREAQLRSWVGAKKLTSSGDTEHAFYNSPIVPGAIRRNEVMIPIG